GLEKWLALNTEFSEKWPNVTQARPAPEEAKKYDGEEGKYEKYFSEEPGEGD
ncbi:MAG: DUF3470 domain-containing protein, partial [Pseudomonadota bacterium]